MVDDGTVTDPRSDLVNQTLANGPVVNGQPTRTVIANTPNDKGWYLDFPDDGERSNVDMVLAQGTLLVTTNVPFADQHCTAGGYSWLNFLDYKTGSYVSTATNAAVYFGSDLTTGLNLVWIKGVPQVIRTGTDSPPTLVSGLKFNPGKTVAGVKGHRVGWREIFTNTK